jgi:RNA polymerase sigma factor (sigma-70 family)
MISDGELVERCRKRDADAFGALVTRHQQLVFGVALARCKDPTLAEDVAQEAFVAAWRDLDRLRDGTRVGSWVAGIARNLAANAVRTRARRERAIAEPTPSAETAPTPEDAAVEREDRELLQRALDDIPDTHRETLVLFYLQGQSVAEIASELGITDDLVKQRLSRARRALRDSVAERVESVLTRTRVSPAFRAGVVAALSTATARKALAGKAILMSTNKIVVTTVAVAAVAGSAIWLGTRSSAKSPEPQHAAAMQSPAASARVDSPHATQGAPIHLRVEKLADTRKRASLLAAIRDARNKRTSTTSSSSTPSAPASGPTLPGGDLDKEYIRAAVKEIIPLMSDCYAEGLERDPTLKGNVFVAFTIEGEPDVGGVVSESAIEDINSTIKDATVRECIQETMYALKIDPPANGGSIKVRYPIAFAPSEAEAPPPITDPPPPPPAGH